MTTEQRILQELREIMLEYGYEDAVKRVQQFLLSKVKEAREEALKEVEKTIGKNEKEPYVKFDPRLKRRTVWRVRNELRADLRVKLSTLQKK